MPLTSSLPFSLLLVRIGTDGDKRMAEGPSVVRLLFPSDSNHFYRIPDAPVIGMPSVILLLLLHCMDDPRMNDLGITTDIHSLCEGHCINQSPHLHP